MTSTDLATVSGDTVTKMINVLPYAYWEVGERIKYANTIAGARGLLPSGMKDAPPQEIAARVFLIFETGAMLGLNPMAALQGMDVIEGNVTISPQLFTGLVRGAGHKLRIKESGSIGAGDFRIDVTLIRKDDPEEPVEASWSLEDAVQAGLCDLIRDSSTGLFRVNARSKNNNPLNWEKYPKDMCQWRALGRLARRGAADVTMGIGYFPEELEVALGELGNGREEMRPFEDALIEEFRKLDDKAGMAALWAREHPIGTDEHRHPSDAWTQRVEAEFAAHVSTLTRDSRPPQIGAPGQTGDPEVDEEIDGQVDDQIMNHGESPTDDDPTETDEERLQRTADEADLAAAAEFELENPAR